MRPRAWSLKEAKDLVDGGSQGRQDPVWKSRKPRKLKKELETEGSLGRDSNKFDGAQSHQEAFRGVDAAKRCARVFCGEIRYIRAKCR